MMKNNLEAFGQEMSEAHDMIENATDNTQRLEGLRKISKIGVYRFYEPYIQTMQTNTLFLLDHMDHLQAALGVELDPNNIGLIGHSLGAGVTVDIACASTQHVKAFVSLDFPQLTSEQEVPIVKVPGMFFYSTKNSYGTLNVNNRGFNEYYFQTALNDCYEITINGTTHMNYSDMTYIAPLGFMGIIGPINGEKAGSIVETYILGFLNKYLMGMDSEILRKPKKEWSGVEFKKREAHE